MYESNYIQLNTVPRKHCKQLNIKYCTNLQFYLLYDQEIKMKIILAMNEIYADKHYKCTILSK